MYSTYFPDPRNHSKIFVLNVELLFDRVRMSWFSNILPDFVDYHTYSSVFHTKDEECFSTSERPGTADERPRPTSVMTIADRPPSLLKESSSRSGLRRKFKR